MPDGVGWLARRGRKEGGTERVEEKMGASGGVDTREGESEGEMVQFVSQGTIQRNDCIDTYMGMWKPHESERKQKRISESLK